MEARKENSFWKRINSSVKRIFEELKEDSVASNPKKPVDCCNPPVVPKLDQEKDSSQH
ncbi:MAG: hypothetical protein JSV26_03750 [bacterium]|nr:MAG: hypothetical protein JSV26_03750 [bacterium]